MTEKRKNARKPIHYPAQIDLGDGAPAQPCQSCDVSDSGAQIQITSPHALPDEFTLVLGYDGSARRTCRVKWRSDTQVGLQFVGRAPAAAD